MRSVRLVWITCGITGLVACGGAAKPEAVDDDAGATPESQPVVIDVLANDKNLGNTPLQVAIVVDGGLGHATVLADNRVQYTPTPPVAGKDTFTYVVTDGGNNSSRAVVSVTITAVNFVPVATGDTLTVPMGGSASVNVLANDRDLYDAPVRVVLDALPRGDLLDGGAGTLTFTPLPGDSGKTFFAYHLLDVDGDVSNVAAVDITITRVNQPPVAAGDLAHTNAGQPVALDVLQNDVDPDGDGLVVERFDPTTTAGGTVVGIPPTLTYEPPAGFYGTDTFAYQAGDGQGGVSAAATVVVRVIDPAATPVFEAGYSRPTDGSLVGLAAEQDLWPARFVFTDDDLDEAAVHVAVFWEGRRLTEGGACPGGAFEVARGDNELDVYVTCLETERPAGATLQLELDNIHTVGDGNLAEPVHVWVTYDPNPPRFTWHDQGFGPEWRAIAEFDEPMDPSSSPAFAFQEQTTGLDVPADDGSLEAGVAGAGWLSRGGENDTFYFVPRDLLSPSLTYAVSVCGLRDLAGNRADASSSLAGTPCARVFVPWAPAAAAPGLPVERVDFLQPGSPGHPQDVAFTIASPLPRDVFPGALAGQSYDLRVVLNTPVTALRSAHLRRLGAIREDYAGVLDPTSTSAIRFAPAATSPAFTWRPGGVWRLELAVGSVVNPAAPVELVVTSSFTIEHDAEAVPPRVAAVSGGRSLPGSSTVLLRRGEALAVTFSELVDPTGLDPSRFSITDRSDANPRPVAVAVDEGDVQLVSLRPVDANDVPVALAPGAYRLHYQVDDVSAGRNTGSGTVDFVVDDAVVDAPALSFSSPERGAARLDAGALGGVWLGFSDSLDPRSFVDAGDPTETPRGFALEQDLYGTGTFIPRKGLRVDPGHHEATAGTVYFLAAAGPPVFEPGSSYRLRLLGGLRSVDGTPLAATGAAITFATAPAGATDHQPIVGGWSARLAQAGPGGALDLTAALTAASLDAGAWMLQVAGPVTAGALGPDTQPTLAVTVGKPNSANLTEGAVSALTLVATDASNDTAAVSAELYRPFDATLATATPVVSAKAAPGVYGFAGSIDAADGPRVARLTVLVYRVHTATSQVLGVAYAGGVQLARAADGSITYAHVMAADAALPPPSAGERYAAVVLLELPALLGRPGDGTTATTDVTPVGWAW